MQNDAIQQSKIVSSMPLEKIQVKQFAHMVLTLLLALPILSTDIYLPSIKEISNIFHANSNQVQSTLTVYFFIFGIIQLIYGPLSDRFGRKPILQLGLFIYVLASLLCALASTIQMLIVGRCLQALGAGSAILTFAIIRDLYEGTQAAKWIAFMSAAVALSPIIAPIIGGYIQLLSSWRGDFVLLFLMGSMLWVLCYRLLPETNQFRPINFNSVKKIFGDYQRLFIHRNYLSNAFSAAFAFGALFAYVTGVPYVLLTLMGYSPQSFGWIFAIAAIGYVLGALINSKLVSRLGLDFMCSIGIISLVSGSAIMTILCYFYAPTAVTIVLPQIICEFGISIVVSTTIAKSLQSIPQYAGAGSALIGFLRFMLATLSSYLVVILHSSTALPLAFTILILSLLLLSCLWRSKLFSNNIIKEFRKIPKLNLRIDQK